MGCHDGVYLGSELNIPTWFSSSSLFLYALLRHVEGEFGAIQLRLREPAASRMRHAA
jgi:hypothetical protein